MVLIYTVVFMLITVFVAVMGVEIKKIILNQIILKPTIIFNKYFVYQNEFMQLIITESNTFLLIMINCYVLSLLNKLKT